MNLAINSAGSGGRDLRAVDEFVGLVATRAMKQGLFGSTSKMLEIDDHGRIAVPHVLNRAFAIAAAWQLGKRILQGNGPVFGGSAGRTPSTTWKTVRERCVQGAAINPSLAARDELGEPHGWEGGAQRFATTGRALQELDQNRSGFLRLLFREEMTCVQ